MVEALVANSNDVHPWIKTIAREVSEYEAPALHAALDRLAAKAGVPKPPIFITDPALLVKNPLTVPMSYNAFATMQGKPAMILGHHLLEHFTNDRSGRTVTAELEAVMGHEMGHLKYDGHQFGPARLYRRMPMAGATAGIVGLMLYKYYYENPDQQKDLVDRLTNDPMLSSHPSREVNPYLHEALVAGQYLAAAGLGLAAGVGGARAMKHFVEYRADRFSAEVLKDGHPLASALTMMQQVSDGIRKEMGALLKQSLDKTGMSVEDYKAQSWFRQTLDRLTYPDTAKRIRTLESMRF